MDDSARSLLEHEATYWRTLAMTNWAKWREHKEGILRRRGKEGLAILLDEMTRQQRAGVPLLEKIPASFHEQRKAPPRRGKQPHFENHHP